MASSSGIKYPKPNELDVQEFLPIASRYLEWEDFSSDVVMEVGCGTGNISTRHITTLFPNVQKIIAIDLDPVAICVAKEKFSQPKIEYHLANIEDISTLSEWLGKISIVISVNCFALLNDQTVAFENVYKLMTPGGQAAIRFCLQSSYYEAFTDLMEQPRWKTYFRNVCGVVPESHKKKLGVSHYITILKEIGFQVVLCQEEEASYLYESEAECRRHVTKCVLTDVIPNDYKEEFKQAIFETFLKHNPKESGDRPRMRQQMLSILVKKLETSL